MYISVCLCSLMVALNMNCNFAIFSTTERNFLLPELLQISLPHAPLHLQAKLLSFFPLLSLTLSNQLSLGRAPFVRKQQKCTKQKYD